MLQSQRTRPNVAKMTEAATDTFENHDQDALRRCMERLDGVAERRLPVSAHPEPDSRFPGASPAQVPIMEAMAHGDWMALQKIANSIGKHPEAIRAHLAHLKAKGLVENKRITPHLWLWRAMA